MAILAKQSVILLMGFAENQLCQISDSRSAYSPICRADKCIECLKMFND